MPFLVFLATMLLVSGCATSPVPKQAPLTLHWAGLYDAETTATVKDPLHASGQRTNFRNVRLIAQQTMVPPQFGTHFGVNFTVAGPVAGAPITLRKVMRFPAPGLVNSEGQLFEKNETQISVRAGSPNTFGYYFNHDWEIKEGEWTFEFWKGDELLLKQSLYVSHDAPIPPTPPAPIRLQQTQCQTPEYPLTAKRANAQGQTVLRFTIRADGSIADISVITASGSTPEHVLMDAAAVNAFKSCRFSPVASIELHYADQAVTWILTRPTLTLPISIPTPQKQ